MIIFSILLIYLKTSDLICNKFSIEKKPFLVDLVNQLFQPAQSLVETVEKDRQCTLI